MTVQPIQWVVQFKDGTQVMEFSPDGTETIFTEILERKSELIYLALEDKGNGIVYSINLENGAFILGGPEVFVSKEVDGRVFSIPESCNFADGVIQFKCAKPMAPSGIPTQAEARTYNIGYKVDLPENFFRGKYGDGYIRIVKCQALLSIDAESLKPTMSSTFTMEITKADGRVIPMKV
jgi:hypothetical protein